MYTLQRCVSSQLLKLLLFTVALALIQQVKICFLKQPAARDCHQDWSCFLKSFSEMVEIKQWEVFQMFLEVQSMRMFRANQHDPLKIDGVE